MNTSLKKNFLALVGLLISFVLMTGCATQNKPIPLQEQTAYKSNPDFSYAKNVATAMGLQPHRLKDATISKEKSESLSKAGGSAYAGGTSFVGTALGVTLEHINPSLGLDFGPAAALNLLSSLTIPTSMESQAMYVGWVDPNSTEIVSPLELTEKISAIIGKYLVEEGFQIKPYKKELLGASFEGVMFIGYDKCVDDAQETDCYIGSSRKQDNNAVSITQQGPIFGKMMSYKPDFVGEGEAFMMSGGILDNITKHGIGLDRRFDTLKMWLKVSQELPAEFFLYLGPKKYTYRTESGVLILGMNPLVLNKGRINYFVKVEENRLAQN